MSTADLTSPVVGFFGKLPSKGDFVTRALPKSFVDPYDQWLQRMILESRQSLGADVWLQSYLRTRIWCFCLPPGSLDDQLWLGAMMSSVDKVGRYFPLTIAAALPNHADTLTSACANSAWFGQIQTLLYRALDDESLDLDEFQGALSLQAPRAHRVAAAVTDSAEWSEISLPMDPHGEADAEGVADVNILAQSLAALAPKRITPQTTLWWAGASGQKPAQVLLFRGLPSERGYERLLEVGTVVVDAVPVSAPVASGSELGDDIAADLGIGRTLMPELDVEPPTESSGPSIDELFGEPAPRAADETQPERNLPGIDEVLGGDWSTPKDPD